MKRLILSTFVMSIMSLVAMSENTQYPGIPDGKRVIIQKKDATTDVWPMNNIKEITAVAITDAKVTLTLTSADDASIKIAAEMGRGAKSFISVCYPAESPVESESLQDYILQNGSKPRKAGGTIEYIDLKPETAYTISVLAFDEYDFPCEITSISAITSPNTGNEEIPAIGGYLYADGSWSKELKTNKTPVAIIFSTTPSDIDRQNGYTHGYAMALKSVDGDAWTTEADEMESGEIISSTGDGDLNDLDGRTHTEFLMKRPDIHPAAAAASAFGETPAGTSGWYLPSSGQFIAIFHNLGALTDDSFSRQPNGAAAWNPEAASAAITSLNGKLAKAGEGRYDSFGTYTWTSSEASVMSAYYLYCHPSGGMILQPYYKDSKFDIRPVLAF